MIQIKRNTLAPLDIIQKKNHRPWSTVDQRPGPKPPLHASGFLLNPEYIYIYIYISHSTTMPASSHNRFITSQASHRILLSKTGLQPPCCLSQQLIPGIMAICIIDEFEVAHTKHANSEAWLW